MAMWELLPRRDCDPKNILGHINYGNAGRDIVQIFLQGDTKAVEPTLNWYSDLTRPKPRDTEVDLFRVLSWRMRLTSTLEGRREADTALHSWVHEGGPIRLRLLSGPGGSGKSR